MNKKIGLMELTESLKELSSNLFLIVGVSENLSQMEHDALFSIWRSMGNITDELQEEIETFN